MLEINIKHTRHMGLYFRFPKKTKIEMPCGHFFILEIEDLKRNIPCPCGNPNHWIVKWEINE